MIHGYNNATSIFKRAERATAKTLEKAKAYIVGASPKKPLLAKKTDVIRGSNTNFAKFKSKAGRSKPAATTAKCHTPQSHSLEASARARLGGKTKGLQSSKQARATHSQQDYSFHKLPNAPTLNPLTKKALDTLKQKDFNGALAQMQAKIPAGEEAGTIKEAIDTGLSASSLKNEKIGNKELGALNKSELTDVMNHAKERIDVRVKLNELSPEAANTAKTKIDNILNKFSHPNSEKNNMNTVMSQLKGDITDAKNAKDAESVLSKALDRAEKGQQKSSLNEVMMDARTIALSKPNGSAIKNILLDFGETSGVYKQQAEELLTKYGKSFNLNKGIEHLSNKDLSAVVRVAKFNAPDGPEGLKVKAAIDQFAQQAKLK